MRTVWFNKLNKKLKYLVAVSGGPDSMFLLDNLVSQGFLVIACHVNYHKRLSSNVDQQIVAEFCENHGIPLEIKNVTLNEYSKGNFQDQARVIRYNFFCDVAQKYQIYNLVVAHHVYDLIETYLIQKQRKAIVSYYGLKFKNIYKHLAIYRPMLEIKKEDILDYLTLNKVKYGFDETNELMIYERNRIRQQQISKYTDFDINLILSEIKALNSEQELIKDELEVIYNSIISDNVLSVLEFKKYFKNIILQQMIIYEYISNFDEALVLKLKKAKIKEVVRVLNNTKKANITIILSDKIWILKEYNNAIISLKPRKIDYCYIIKKPGNYKLKNINITNKAPTDNHLIWQGIKIDQQHFPLTIKVNKGNEKITLSNGTKKINRLFIDNKIAYRLRINWPIILNVKNEVICIPFLAVSQAISEKQPNVFLINKLN